MQFDLITSGAIKKSLNCGCGLLLQRCKKYFCIKNLLIHIQKCCYSESHLSDVDKTVTLYGILNDE